MISIGCLLYKIQSFMFIYCLSLLLSLLLFFFSFICCLEFLSCIIPLGPPPPKCQRQFSSWVGFNHGDPQYVPGGIEYVPGDYWVGTRAYHPPPIHCPKGNRFSEI